MQNRTALQGRKTLEDIECEVRRMLCKDAEKLVIPYIRHQLDNETMEKFLEHVDSCENCKEELEIYYTVEAGIRQLDRDTGHYNIKGDMEAAILSSKQKLYKLHLLKIGRYAVDTLMIVGMLVTVILQIRIWWQTGIF